MLLREFHITAGYPQESVPWCPDPSASRCQNGQMGSERPFSQGHPKMWLRKGIRNHLQNEGNHLQNEGNHLQNEGNHLQNEGNHLQNEGNHSPNALSLSLGIVICPGMGV